MSRRLFQHNEERPRASDLASKSAIAATRVGRSAMIDSPFRESRANGAVEVAFRTWQGQSQTLRHYFETCMGKTMSADNVIFGGLVVWAAETLLKYRIRKDGRTSYGAMTGHRCSEQAVSFGERVQFKMATDKNDRRNGQTEWSEGIFIGVITRSIEFIVIDEHGLYKCTRMQKGRKRQCI